MNRQTNKQSPSEGRRCHSDPSVQLETCRRLKSPRSVVCVFVLCLFVSQSMTGSVNGGVGGGSMLSMKKER